MKNLSLLVERITTLVVLYSILCRSVVVLGQLPLFRQEFLHTGTQELLGSGVAITPDGRRLAIGASAGEKVYVYDRNSSGFWDQSAILSIPVPVPKNTAYYFGENIGISFNGDLIAVAAPSYDYLSPDLTGAIFIFQFNGSGWTNNAIVLESPPEETTKLCYRALALSYDGNTIVCDRGYGFPYTWGVDVFVDTGTAWEQQGPSIITPFDHQCKLGGVALSSNGSVLALGAPANKNASGEVYVYTRNNSGIWSAFGGSGLISAQPLVTSFGNQVAMSADASVIAIKATNNISPVFVFGLSSQTYELLDTISRPPGASSNFGKAFVMSSSGNRIVIGDNHANFASSPVNVYYGGAFIFDRLISSYNYTGEVYSTQLERYGSEFYVTGFGYAISLTEGNVVVIGALFNAHADGKLMCSLVRTPLTLFDGKARRLSLHLRRPPLHRHLFHPWYHHGLLRKLRESLQVGHPGLLQKNLPNHLLKLLLCFHHRLLRRLRESLQRCHQSLLRGLLQRCHQNLLLKSRQSLLRESLQRCHQGLRLKSRHSRHLKARQRRHHCPP